MRHPQTKASHPLVYLAAIHATIDAAWNAGQGQRTRLAYIELSGIYGSNAVNSTTTSASLYTLVRILPWRPSRLSRKGLTVSSHPYHIFHSGNSKSLNNITTRQWSSLQTETLSIPRVLLTARRGRLNGGVHWGVETAVHAATFLKMGCLTVW